MLLIWCYSNNAPRGKKRDVVQSPHTKGAVISERFTGCSPLCDGLPRPDWFHLAWPFLLYKSPLDLLSLLCACDGVAGSCLSLVLCLNSSGMTSTFRLTGFDPHRPETFCFWNCLCYTDRFHQLLPHFHFISTTCFSFNFRLSSATSCETLLCWSRWRR